MFRSSLKVFLVLTLVALAAILGFAALRLRGPEEQLREAQAALDRGEFARSIAVLDLAERSHSLQRDPSKQLRLHRLRFQANLRLDNLPAALRDLEQLLQQPGASTPELELEHVRLLAAVGQGEAAGREAQAFLQRHPGHGRARELAGEALQSLYREELGQVFATVDRDLGASGAQTARAAMLAYLYRPDGDTEVEQGRNRLQAIYRARPSLAPGWTTLAQRLLALRQRIQESLGHFQAALEADGEPIAAMRGLSLSLDQSARTEDLLLLCEIYHHRFQHAYVHEAGAAATWALLRRGAPQAALATALRWLPTGSVKATSDPVQFGPGTMDLLLARYAAARTFGDRKLLEQLGSDMRAVEALGIKAGPLSAVLYGTLNHLRGDHEKADRDLRWGLYQLLQRPLPLGQVELVPELVAMQLQSRAARGMPESDQLVVFTDWQKGRPGDLRPRFALAEFQRQRGRPAAGLLVLEEAAATAPDDAELFVAKVRLAAEAWQETDLNAERLLLQCLQHGEKALDLPNPLAFLHVAEIALQREVGPVALAAARRASDKFPNQMLPRLLEARAELLLGRHAAAVEVAAELLKKHPEASEAAEVLLAALRAGGAPTRPHLQALQTAAAASPAMAAELLRAALVDQPAHAVRLVPAGLQPTQPAALLLLAATALARSGDAATAVQWLDAVQQNLMEAPDGDRTAFVEAAAAWLQAAAAQQADATLAEAAEARLRAACPLPAAAANHLWPAAEALAASHPRTAYCLVATALETGDPTQRNGRHHAAAARLALRLGKLRRALEHAMAALPFGEDAEVPELLTLLCLADQRLDRAQQAYRLVEQPTRAALAARMGRLAEATALATAALAADPADLTASILLQLLDPSNTGDDLQWGDPAARLPVLELLSLLAERGLGRAALAPAAALAASRPASPRAQLLLARAHADAGHAEAAFGIYRQLQASGKVSLQHWREVALAQHGYDLPLANDLVEALARGISQNLAQAPPLARAVATTRTADFVARSGNQAVADQLRSDQWQLPGAPLPTLAEVEGLRQRGRKLDALRLFERLQPTLRGDAALRCRQQTAAVAAELILAGDKNSLLAIRSAHALLATGGAYGNLLHALLGVSKRGQIPAFEPTMLRQLLRSHLQLVASGQDHDAELPATLQLLVEVEGLDAVLALLEKELEKFPTQWPLWRSRAELRCRRGEPETALQDLRRVASHRQDPAVQLDVLVLAGAFLQWQPEDGQRLAGLPQAMQDSPRGQLARGLWLLHLGKPDEAVAPLQKAAPQPDGLQLQALALANLQARPKDGKGRERALTALKNLQQNYPSSARARYAGSFARQLEPH